MAEENKLNNILEEQEKLSSVEYLIQKINGSGIKLNLSKEQMKEILEAGKEVQKMAVKYGTNQDIQINDENTFNGYGTYVVSVNEDNARQLGIKIASRKYGGTFYINNQPFSDFLQEKSFSPYWTKLVSDFKDNSVDKLSHSILTSDVKGNPSLEREQIALSTLLSLDLIEYKREQTFLYSVNIPDNDNTNYLLYNNPIGFEHAQKINEQLEKLGTSWRVSRNDIGKNIYFNVLSNNVFNGNQKKSSEFLKNLGYVGMQMDNANYIVFNDKDMSITDRVQFMKDVNGEVYGFAYQGVIYADENLVNSNVLAHEYTHIWDKYVQNNNPELWQHGKDILKGTSLWQEITGDKNYENLKTDDEILSECHARVVGKMAEQVLERIEREDGGLTRDRVIDWDKEVSQYIAEELNINPELGSENYISENIKAEYLKEFLSMPMKDLMNEVELNKKDLTPGQKIAQTSTQKAEFPSPESTQFPITEPNLMINNTVNLKNNQIKSVKNLSKINTETIQPREFLVKIKESFNIPDVNHSGYVENTIDNKKYVLRLSNHSINSFYARNNTQETSLVIKLSEHDFIDHKDRLVKEYVYLPENLTKDVKDNIVKGLVDWVNTGTYSYDKADKINVTSDYEKEISSKPQKMVIGNNNKKEIDVNTYRFASGQTIDEILKTQTSWSTDEQCLLNMIDSNWRAVDDFITDKEKEVAKKFLVASNNPEVDLKLLTVQSDVATQFLCQKHTNQELWEKARNNPKGMTRPFSKDVVNIENQINFFYELPSWMKEHIEEIPNNWFQKTPAQLQKEQEREDIQTTVALNNIAKDIVIEPYSRKPEDIEAMKLFIANVSGNDIEIITKEHAQAFIDNLGITEEAYLTSKADGSFEYTNNNPYSPDIYKTSEPKEILSIIEDYANDHLTGVEPDSEQVKDFVFIHSINEKIKYNEKIVLLSNQLESANKTIHEQNKQIKEQDQLLNGKVSVKVNGIERKFEHGLKHAFPEAVKQLDRQIQINKDLTRAYNNLAKSKSNDISQISPSDDGNTYS